MEGYEFELPEAVDEGTFVALVPIDRGQYAFNIFKDKHNVYAGPPSFEDSNRLDLVEGADALSFKLVQTMPSRAIVSVTEAKVA